MNIKTIIINLVFLTLSFYLLTPYSLAQQLTLSLSPPLIETIIKPGKSILIAYRLENLGDPAIFRVNVLPFSARGIYGDLNIENEFSGPVRFFLDNSDIKMNEPFFLKTQASQQLLLRIRIPEGAPISDYYYTLLAISQPPPSIDGISSSQVKATIGSNLLITVTSTGQIQLNGKISSFEILPRFQFSFRGKTIRVIDSQDKIIINSVVENLGENYIKPQGEIVLRGNFGETSKYEYVPKNILAHSKRLTQAQPSFVPDCADKKVKEQICLTPATLIINGFFIGRYQLSTTIFFGVGSPNLYANTDFYAIPIKFIVGIFVVIIISVIIVKKVKVETE